jgi:hypothetical protein
VPPVVNAAGSPNNSALVRHGCLWRHAVATHLAALASHAVRVTCKHWLPLKANLGMKSLLSIGALCSIWNAAHVSCRLVGDSRTLLSHNKRLAGAIMLIVSPINWSPSFDSVITQCLSITNLFLAEVAISGLLLAGSSAFWPLP